MKIIKKSVFSSSILMVLAMHAFAAESAPTGGSVSSFNVAKASKNSIVSTPTIPPGAIKTGDIQALSNWDGMHDTGGSGSSTGKTSIVGSPSISGNARKFVTNFRSSGDERFAVTFGEDTVSTAFLYDGWVYLDNSSGSIGNLEMDLNQVMSNGQNATFGVQCDGGSGTWDYTENAGTPQSSADIWVHSQQPCNPRTWSINTWHHVQISYSRDDSGNVTYQSVWLDGVEQAINATVPSAFALGWGPVLQTQFQVDGYGKSGTTRVYLDNLTIYRWSNTSPNTPLIPNGSYLVVSAYSGLAVDDPGFSGTAGTEMQMYAINNGTNQQWTVTNQGQNVITLTNAASGQLLDVIGASTSNGALVDQWPDNGQTNQQWYVTSLGNGAFELTSVSSGLALDVYEGGKTNGTPVDQYPYLGNPWQQWIFQAP